MTFSCRACCTASLCAAPTPMPGSCISTQAAPSDLKKDGWLKATGQAEYADDIFLPGMLHGKLVRSPHPHARIVHIDASRALRSEEGRLAESHRPGRIRR